jgi:L-alanine-DL-glutamate epimerase-like enolase superfamily enzyme
MTPSLTVRAETWPLKGSFAISRGAKTTAQVVVARVADGGITGRGEAVPYPRYGDTVAGVVAAIEAQAVAVAAGMDRGALASAMGAGAARCALDCALWDLAAKREGVRAWTLAGAPAPRPVPTFDTLSLDTPEAMGRAAAALRDWGALKVKLGSELVVESMRAVREAAPKARLIVDPNEAWTMADLRAHAAPLADLGVEMIEQPVPAGADEALSEFASPVPLCADESCHTVRDLSALAGRYQIVSIKLDKTGGLTEALRLADAARAAGFGIMVSCMVSTSLAMAPATLLAEGAAIVDLDGPRWLTRDRDHGLVYEGGRVHSPTPELWG